MHSREPGFDELKNVSTRTVLPYSHLALVVSVLFKITELR